MKAIVAALFVFPLMLSTGFAQDAAPDPAAGKALWEGANTQCKNCHGMDGEGALGPDLAGRGLSAAEFQQAVRRPWGIMPLFVDSQVSDAELADMAAYFSSLPKAATTGPWRVPLTGDQPLGQQLYVSAGCAQCHGATFDLPRGTFGAVNADFELFKNLVYNHTTATPELDAMLAANRPPPPGGGAGRGPSRLRMGNFNSLRVSESELQEIFNWVRDDIGFRPSLQARLMAGAAGPDGATTYTLNVTNNGLKGKGLAAQGVKIDLTIPGDVTVVSATGDGYKGVHKDAPSSANVAEWQVARIDADPANTRSFTITLSAAAAPSALRGTVHWAKPGPKTGPNLDMVNIVAASAGGRGPAAPPRPAP